MQAVEPKTVPIIHALQDINIPVFALTARGYPIMACTLKQLNEIGINFSRESEKAHVELTVESAVNKVVYSHGVIFCNGNDKGKCLKAFFDLKNHLPQSVIMVDDKEKYLTCVKSVVESLGAEYVGLRYGLLDDKVATFEMKKATAQLHKIHDRLSIKAQQAVDRLKLSPLSRYSLLPGAEVKSESKTVVVTGDAMRITLKK